jgi:dolichol-phosphate mannosyltransferase
MTKKPPFVSIILPTFNEQGNIAELIRSIDSMVTLSKEIIVVDDDSPDGTAQTVLKLQKDNPSLPIVLIIRKHNHGLVLSLNEGIQKAKGNIIAWMDADFSHPPHVLNMLIHAVSQGKSDVAIASRYSKGGKPKHEEKGESRLSILAGTFLNILLSRFFSFPVTDFTSGFVALDRTFLKSYKLKGSYGEYFLDLVIHLIDKKAKITEIGYESPPRMYGISKTAPTLKIFVKHGILYLKAVYNIWIHKT